MSVKKVLTFKSGNFNFSSDYKLQDLQMLIMEARILYETVKDLPILPQLSTQLEKELIRRSIFGTAAIEGNPLSEDQVNDLINETRYVSVNKKAELEIGNLKKAYEFVKTLPTPDKALKIDENLIKQIHNLITFGIQDEYNNPGHYRNHIVKVGDKNHGGIYTPPKCLKDIENLMQTFIKWINSPEMGEMEIYIRAALAHFHLGLIHPFGDGNGRTARLVEAMILQVGNIKFVPIMLSNFYYRNIDDYFFSFSITRKNKDSDVAHFVKFVLVGVIESLKEIKTKITYFIRIFTLRDYYSHLRKEKQLTQRQYDLIKLLLDQPKAFVLNDFFEISPFNLLYRKVSERTARRDITKLKKRKIIFRNDDGQFELNLNILG